MLGQLDLSAPHTTHCLADGNIMISTFGDGQGNARGRLSIFSSSQAKVQKLGSEAIY